jgi:hypothetical protein
VTDERGEADGRSRLRRRQSVGRTGARFPRLDDASAAPDPEPGPASSSPPSPSHTEADDPRVGRTGARFASRSRRERLDRDAGPLALPPGPSSRPSAPADDTVADPLVGHTGARFDSRARRTRRDAERQAAQDAVVPTQAAPVTRQVRPAPPAPPLGDAPTAPLYLSEMAPRAEGVEPRVSVRPYVRTRGRTHARADLRVETLVSIPSPRPPVDDPEHQAISDLCDGPRSVAELAALLRVPLGVARILIGDMAAGGLLTVHPTADRLSTGPIPDAAVLARVLRGLHRL